MHAPDGAASNQIPRSIRQAMEHGFMLVQAAAQSQLHLLDSLPAGIRKCAQTAQKRSKP